MATPSGSVTVVESLFVRVSVADFPAWRAAFCANATWLAEAGIKSARIYRNMDDASEVLLLCEVDRGSPALQFGTQASLAVAVRNGEMAVIVMRAAVCRDLSPANSSCFG
jgi:hypothetical protein